jgi:alpha-tubulin suppressor-like RCC1 family protein
LYDTQTLKLFTPLPTKLAIEVKFKQVAFGAHHTIALANDGRVFGCGSDQFGQLGCGKAASFVQTLTQASEVS